METAVPVDPFLEPLLPTLAPMPERIDDWSAYRAQARQGSDAMVEQLTEPGPEVGNVRTVSLPVPGGAIDLRVYQPAGEGPHPVHLYLHGGGWVIGSAHDRYVDITSRERCEGAGCVVVAVDYRKAPEHRFPTALEDAQAALEWVVANAADLGVRPDRITLGGQSAGANLIAGLALKLRDEQGPRIALQLLEAPALDLTLSLPSHETYGTGYALHLADVRRLGPLYLSDPDQATHPYASPLLAPDLSGLPPAYVMSAEYDMLRDDGERYVERLQQAGVPATFSLQRGHVHISPALTKPMAAARAWRDEAIGVLRLAHQGAAVPAVSSTR
jgi:acetyl esterase